MATDAFKFKLSDAVLDELSQCDSNEERGKTLLRHINNKLEGFNRWCEENLDGPVAEFEMAILRTFLYREATGENEGIGTIADLPRIVIEGHPAFQ